MKPDPQTPKSQPVSKPRPVKEGPLNVKPIGKPTPPSTQAPRGTVSKPKPVKKHSSMPHAMLGALVLLAFNGPSFAANPTSTDDAYVLLKKECEWTVGLDGQHHRSFSGQGLKLAGACGVGYNTQLELSIGYSRSRNDADLGSLSSYGIGISGKTPLLEHRGFGSFSDNSQFGTLTLGYGLSGARFGANTTGVPQRFWHQNEANIGLLYSLQWTDQFSTHFNLWRNRSFEPTTKTYGYDTSYHLMVSYALNDQYELYAEGVKIRPDMGPNTHRTGLGLGYTSPHNWYLGVGVYQERTPLEPNTLGVSVIWQKPF